ncbi:MAG: glycosyltransferase family 4 protein [Pseudomonadota bacterium]
MKITFVLPANLMNGGIRVIGIVASTLVARGHDVRLITQPQRQPTLKRRLKTLLRDRHWLPARKDGPFLDPVLDRVSTLETGRPVTDADLPDANVVVATWWETAPWVQALSDNKGAKAYFMQDYGAPGQEIEKIAPTWEMPFTFITLNTRLKAMILERNPGADVEIMRNAVDQTLFNSAPRPRGRPPKIGLMCRVQASKGMQTAARALKEARDALPELRAVAVNAGDEDWPDWVEKPKNPDDRALAEIYRSCDLWLFPSRMEGFGLPIIEAMASRTPVISTRVGGAPDVIESGVNGYLVEIDDWKGMADHAVDLLSGPEARWAAMGEAAAATVAEHTWDDAVDVFERALQRAVQRQTSSK